MSRFVAGLAGPARNARGRESDGALQRGPDRRAPVNGCARKQHQLALPPDSNTVLTYVHIVYDKLHVDSPSSAVAKALCSSII